MSPGARGLFRISIVKDAEAISRSGDAAAGPARSDGCSAPIESDSELILDLHQAIRAGDGMARQIAGTWLDKHETRLSEALKPLGEIRARLDRSEKAGSVEASPRPENRRSRKRFSCDEATRQMIGDAVVASAIACPERGEQQTALTRALQTANYLLAPQSPDGAAAGGRSRLGPLTQTPVLPAGLIPERDDRAKRPEADAGGLTAEPLSWRMAAGALEALRAVDADALLTGQSEAASDRVLVPACIVEGLPGPLREALAARQVDPATISLIGLAEHLTKLRALLYRGERRLAGAAAGRPFEPGEWRDLPGLGWRYVLPPSTAPMPPPGARVAASADWTYVDGVGWVLIANAGRGEDLVSREAAGGASVRILGVADLLSVEERRIRYRAGEIAPAGGGPAGNGLELPTARPTTGMGNGDMGNGGMGNAGMADGGTGNGSGPPPDRRFTLEHAVSEVMAEDRTAGFGALVPAALGPAVPLDGGPGLEHRTADELARRTASRYAGEIIERAVARIQAGRTDPGRHASAGEAGTNGGGRRGAADRWIDGIHELRMMSLGKRLMIEAVVAEPGAWLRHRRYSGPAGSAPPAPFAISFEDVTEDSYAGFAATWQAGDIKPPPAEYKVVGTAATLQAEPEGYVHHTGTLVIPAGYRCARALATLHRGPARPKPDDDPIVTLAGQSFTRYAPGRYGIAPDAEFGSGELPFTFGAVAPVGIGVPLSITAICRRIDGQLYRKWQIDTFDALLRGYRRLKSEYEASAASRDGPRANRAAEMHELRRLCTEAIAGGRLPPSAAVHEAGDARTHVDGADRLAALIGFFGDAFEWDNISCDLYPHFWADAEQSSVEPADEPDPRHRAFLGAGAARVRIPVKPGAERDVLYFLDFGGLCPNNAGVPVARERLALLSDIETFSAGQPGHGQPRPYGEPWLVRVPTPAVTPADGSDLPDDWIPLSTTSSGASSGASSGGANDNDHD